MPKVCYVPKTFSADRLTVIEKANQILDDYHRQGYDLTLRQLYYQFVSRALIPNKDTEYKRLGDIINDARLAGLIDWSRIEDRTRNLRSLAHWDSPREIVSACASQYREDLWATQPGYVEVWVEKDALVGVLQVACDPLDVPYFSCRGYVSQSEMWAAAMRILAKLRKDKRATILHLGDHDPSGVDMTRDIEDRLRLFLDHHLGYPVWGQFRVHRIALTMEQIHEYNPPPNPAKLTDARARGYIAEHGNESWELDALEPAVLTRLIQTHVKGICNQEAWDNSVTRTLSHRRLLQAIDEHWDETAQFLLDNGHVPSPEEEE